MLYFCVLQLATEGMPEVPTRVAPSMEEDTSETPVSTSTEPTMEAIAELDVGSGRQPKRNVPAQLQEPRDEAADDSLDLPDVPKSTIRRKQEEAPQKPKRKIRGISIPLMGSSSVSEKAWWMFSTFTVLTTL